MCDGMRTRLGSHELANDASRASIRVLLIEDDDIDAEIFAHYAAKMGRIHLDVRRAADFESARQLIHSENFECVIADFWIHERASFNFLSQVQNRQARLPLIVLSSMSARDANALGLLDQDFEFLSKENVSATALEQAITKCASAAGNPANRLYLQEGASAHP